MTEEHFKDLYDRYWKSLLDYAHRITADPKASEDIVQDVFVKLWRLPEKKTAEIGDIQKWLSTCIYNQSCDHIRLTKKKRADVEEHFRSFHGRDSDQEYYRKLFNTLLDRINPRKREIYTMHKVEEIPQAEIAKRMNLSVKRIKNIIYEVTRELKEEIKPSKGDLFAFEDPIE